MGVFESEKVQQTIAEANILGELLSCTDQMLPCQEARTQLRSIFEAHRPDDPESWLKHSAMARLLGEATPFPENLETEKTATAKLFLRGAHAWALWAAGRIQEAQIKLSASEVPSRQGGDEIHLMALGPWYCGVEALLRGDLLEARRYFRRSMEVGSQFGTETNNAIQWSYAATFFVPGE